MNDLKRIIANNITNLRKSKNLTQLEFAKELNYSDKAISKWERAESIPDVVVLKQIADFFGVTIDYLLNEHLADEDLIPIYQVETVLTPQDITMDFIEALPKTNGYTLILVVVDMYTKCAHFIPLKH